MIRYFIYLLFLIAIVFNILWFWVKFTLKRNGYKTNWFSNHLNDIPNIYRLEKKTEDPRKRKRYYYMAIALTVSILIFPLAIIYFIFL